MIGITDSINYFQKLIRAEGRAWLSAALVILVLLVGRSATAADHGWMLRQNSIAAGDTEVYVTPSGVKLVYLASGLTIVATAPSWKAQIFNPRKHTRYAESLHDLGTEIGLLVGGLSEDHVITEWHKDKETTILGHKALRYNFLGTFQMSGVCKGEACFAMDMPIYKELAEYLATAAVVPNMKFVRFVTLEVKIKHGEHWAQPLSTKEIRPFTPPPHFWEVPSNYKPGKHAFDIGGTFLDGGMLDEMKLWEKRRF